MIRRFNYTGRIKIASDDISITLMDGSSNITEFRAAIQLDSYGFPLSAKVYLEAYFKSSMMRFDYGNSVEAAQRSMEIHRLDSLQSSMCFFRVKVVDESSEVGQILAVAERIAPVTDEMTNIQKLSLIYVVQADLGHRIWKLEIDDQYSMPVLYVNSTIDIPGPVNQIVHSNSFFNTLVFPAVVEQVLTKLIFIDESDGELDEDWRSKWMQFAIQLCPVADVLQLSVEEKQDWIDSVVDQFCININVIELFETAFRDKE